ncbi:MAG: hypothetical protein WAR37_03815 [Candidatus Microsaccharimonas sp.]
MPITEKIGKIMATGRSYLSEPDFKQQDQLEREYDEAVKRGDIKVLWWQHVISFAIYTAVLLVAVVYDVVINAIEKFKELVLRRK